MLVSVCKDIYQKKVFNLYIVKGLRIWIHNITSLQNTVINNSKT